MKKLILTSLSAAALLASCSDAVENFEQAAQSSIEGRAKVNLTISTPETRLAADPTQGIVFTSSDVLGSALVDAASLWSVANGNNVAHQKWEYVPGQGFKTASATAVGSWLFYAQYDKKNTTSREGVTYEFPQIQEGYTTMDDMAKNDFLVSPIVKFDGAEAEDMNLNVQVKTANSRVILDFDMPAGVTSISKIIAKAQQSGTDVSFAKKSLIKNTALPVADVRRSVWPGAPTYPDFYSWRNTVINNAGNNLVAQTTPISTTVNNYSVATNLLAVDCLNHTDASPLAVNGGKVKTFMLFPAAEYSSVTFYLFTNKGIYKKVVTNNRQAAYDAAAPADKAAVLAAAPAVSDGVVTMPHRYVNLAKAEQTSGSLTAGSLKVETLITAAQAETDMSGVVALSTADLIEVINGITEVGNKNILVLGDGAHAKPQITKAVADAIAAKEAALGGDIQLTFSTKIDVIGEATPYNLNDITFNGGAILKSGQVNVNDQVVIGASAFEVAGGATANVVNLNINYGTFATLANGTLNLNVAPTPAKTLTIAAINNAGILNVKQNANVTTVTNEAGSTTVIDAKLTAAIVNNNNSANNAGAYVTVNGELVINATSSSSSKSTIVNNGLIQIDQATITNNGTINNVGKIISGTVGTNNGILNNAGTITNTGYLYCFNGDNIINNTGVINAKAGSTTYITTNSSAAETTNTKAVTMGNINLDNRDEDVSVTTANQKGYIVWTTDAETIDHKSGDKFNKVVLSAANATVKDSNVRYITSTSKKLTITTSKVQELVLNTDMTIYTTSATVGYLEIASGKVVKLPTENVIAVEDVNNATSVTKANINNKGTFLVGGNLWSTAITACPSQGTFASGDGNSTAFHWGVAKP